MDTVWITECGGGGVFFSREVSKDQQLLMCSGDVPDWFYRLRRPKTLAEHCVMDLLTPMGLGDYAQQGIISFKPAQLAYGMGVPSFVNYDLPLRLYIDDYIGLRLHGGNEGRI